jgi:hypothetical protein
VSRSSVPVLSSAFLNDPINRRYIVSIVTALLNNQLIFSGRKGGTVEGEILS